MAAKRFLGALVALQFVFALAVTGIAQADDPGGQQTPLGEITSSDKDLLVKVRQAGLWEIPMGEEAQTLAESQRVKEVGAQLASDHKFLDERVVKLAGEMGVPLPDTANANQQSWMTELRGLKGAEFDSTFANRLRAAHGQVFGAIAKVRSGTRNDAIRQFAQVCNNVVQKHMTLLESTNLVTEPGLSDPVPAGGMAGMAGATAPAGGTVDPALASSQTALLSSGLTPLMIVLMVLVGATVTIVLLRLLKPKHSVR
jgi:predicted outer membrane protein